MGWSERGTGRSYDSFNGYAFIIGYLNTKILDYTTINRKYEFCANGSPEGDHDRRLHSVGKAKAMKADAVVELNDLVGNFVMELYQVGRIRKEFVKRGVIDHVKKCFTYAIALSKGENVNLANILRQFPDHLFGYHENCGEWCESDRVYAVKLKDPKLYDASSRVFGMYAQNATKFSIAASRQPNESVNDMVAHKSKKNICLSEKTSSLDPDTEILELPAVCNGSDSSVRIKPTGGISPAATEVNGFRFQNSNIYFHDKLVPTKSMKVALSEFKIYLDQISSENNNQDCSLVAHNAPLDAPFDAPRLVRAIVNCNMTENSLEKLVARVLLFERY
ncbi:hypothetical protein QAD02_020447 [Eretmocerus hayati]|uniref:Uncharacterized protein n=1 Tax=Eretmocerus hayati TaxID=131215 RepID=A0ACC2PM51_9HYME|nr:hypothetical protein QAD02_020447 [Eretmocerus hayati]